MAAKPTAGKLFGDRIRELRQQSGLTQAQMAERCGVPQARMSELEKGESSPTLVTIIRVAVALDCKVSVLMSVFDRHDVAALLPK